MNVTSMLSWGYLQPSTQNQSVKKLLEDAQRRQQEQVDLETAREANLARTEQDILSQESALKIQAGDAEVHTVYQYAIGADGRRYITGASVTITGDQEDVTRAGGSVVSREIRAESGEEAEQENAVAVGDAEAQSSEEPNEDGLGESFSDELSETEKAQINKLKQAENEVRAHEAAHKAVAGQFGGGISYSYTQGPDGRRYITGGEVPIQMKEGATPEETLRNMQQVQRAALAPASPSGQDLKVAASAAARAAQAQGEIIAETREESVKGISSNSQTEQKQDESDEDDARVTTVARGTPIIDQDEPETEDPAKGGVASVMAYVRALQLHIDDYGYSYMEKEQEVAA